MPRLSSVLRRAYCGCGRLSAPRTALRLQTKRTLRWATQGPLTRLFNVVKTASTALVNPERGDMVAQLGDLTADVAVQRMRDQMRGDAVGRSLLRDRPRIRSEDVESWGLAELPRGTLGREYHEFMASHGWDANSRSEVKPDAIGGDAELRWVMQRYRECHDMWHVLCGVPPSITGELALKWFELAQTGLPSTALAAFVGPLRAPAGDRALLARSLVPWACRAGLAARPLMCVRYEDQLMTPVVQLREELRLEAAPQGGGRGAGPREGSQWTGPQLVPDDSEGSGAN